MYDAYGQRVEWWDANTLSSFRERTQCVASQFSAYEFEDGEMVNGNLTLGMYVCMYVCMYDLRVCVCVCV